MSNIVIFTPRHEIEYKKNLSEFIEFGRRLPKLNDAYDYDSNYWPEVGNFNIHGVSNQNRDPKNLLEASLIPFAKAYVTYGGETKSKIMRKFYALRAINAVLLEKQGNFELHKLAEDDLNNAVSIVAELYKPGTAYQAGTGLNDLLKFLAEHKMIKPFTWKSGLKKPRENGTSEEDEKKRESKMPDENALMALAQISSAKDTDLSPRDMFTTSHMTLLITAPSRGSEPFYLKADCIHEELMEGNRAVELGLSKEEVKELILQQKKQPHSLTVEDISLFDNVRLKGLLWFGGKGYGYENKWIPTVMYDAVTIAINRLKKMSSNARAFAKELELSEEFPRHELCPNVNEHQPLTKYEAAMALGCDLDVYKDGAPRRNAANQFLKNRGISNKDYAVTLSDLNKVIRERLPEGFPYIPFKNGNGKIKLKWSEALYCSFENFYHADKATLCTGLFIPTINTLNENMAPTKKKNRATGGDLEGQYNIFQRWNYGDLKITSHQLRHLVDTLAAVNGMGEELRARWASRSDPKHNRYYDHTTAEEYSADYLEDRESEIKDLSLDDRQPIQVQIATPRTIQELNTKAALTAHTTEFGMCITSYLSEPCTKYRDCINCSEHVCTKGEDGKCERIRQRLKREQSLLKKDKKAFENGVKGAKQWLDRRLLTTSRLQAIVDMLDDSSIPDGTLIKLPHSEDVSLLDRAMDANGKKRLPKIKNFKRVKASSVQEFIQSDESQNINSAEADELRELAELALSMSEES